MKQLLVILFSLYSIWVLNARTPDKHSGDSINSSIYFTYKNATSERDSLIKALVINNSKTKYSNNEVIKRIPQVSKFSMYKDGDQDKFGFLFNDPHYSATEKKKVSAIILQGVDIESQIINEIRYITLNKEYNPSPSANFIPIFPGGYRAMIKYLNENITASAIEKNKEDLEKHTYLIICFIVEKDGTLNHIKIIDSCNGDLDNKAYKLIKNMPKWITTPQTGSKPIFIAMQLIFNKDI